MDFDVDGTIDVLMITYNRPAYTRLALEALLRTCDERMSVWLWHNGNDAETLAVVDELRRHPRVKHFLHSSENKRLREPTNWLLSDSKAELVGKVDDDCIVPGNWADRLQAIHAVNPLLGIAACWHCHEDDFLPRVAQRKIRTLNGGYQLLENLWVGGSGYLMKRSCVDRLGLLQEGQSFSNYCISVAKAGWINGWYYPLLCQEHMDDPRSEHTLLKSDADLKVFLPLSARTTGVRTLAEWTGQLRQSAKIVQEASVDPRDYEGWRVMRRRLGRKLRKAITGKKGW